MSASLFTYRFYARLTPGDQVPSVWCGDIDGPNVYKVCNHPLMLTAKVHAWWRNRHRVPPLRYDQSSTYARVGDEQRLTLVPLTWVTEPDGTRWPA